MSETLYSDPYFSVVQPDDGDAYIGCDNEVMIVPIDASGRVVLISEPSSAFGGSCLLLPGGMIDEGETCSVAANRELQEEAGYAAGSLRFLGEIRPFSKYLSVKTFIFVGQDLVASQLSGDEAHDIEKQHIAGDDLLGLIQNGKLNDARVIAALFMSGVVSLAT
ncbi:MAG: NUDIX domain-containing protein [Geminicoccaceae bacterium]